jgi:DNA-binding NtrC family response regulator
MTAKTLQLLLVEDNPAHAELIRRAFLSYDRQVELTVARSLQEARATLATVQPDLAIIDLLLPDGRGLELLPGDESAASYPSVMMTSHGNEQAAVEAIKTGAVDYVVKSDATLTDMPHIAERALRAWGTSPNANDSKRSYVRRRRWKPLAPWPVVLRTTLTIFSRPSWAIRNSPWTTSARIAMPGAISAKYARLVYAPKPWCNRS